MSLATEARESAPTGAWTSMRVLLVGPLPPPSAGMANQTEQLARLLRDEGAELRVVATNAPYRPAWTARLRGVRAAVRLAFYVASLWRALKGVHLVHVMANSGWTWFLHAAPAVWVARLARIPVVINYRGGAAEAFFTRWFVWVRPTLAQADAVIVPSGFLKAVFDRRRIPVRIVPNVVDLERFQGIPRAAPGAAPHLLIARNLETIYDIPTGLRAFSIVRQTFPGARLTVAGSGSLRADLERLAAQLGVVDAVDFTGSVANAGMPELYRRADLLLNPSRVDNMPISILEALASGVPVVSAEVGGVPFLVEHGRTALLVPPSDPVAMAAEACRILREPELAARLREAGQLAVTQYTWPLVRARLLVVYRSVLRRPAVA